MDVLDRAYAKKLASGIKKITINSTNDGLYFETNSGTSFNVVLPGFHTHSNKDILDKFSYDNTNNKLLYDGQPIVSDGGGIEIVDNYSMLPTKTDYALVFCVDDYTDGSTTRKKGFYLYNKNSSSWQYCSSESGGSCKLTKDLTTNIANGGINAGVTYKKDTDIEVIIRDLLIKYFPTDLVFSLNPSKTLYKIGEVVNTIDLIATVTKKSENIENIKYYIDGVLVDTKDETTNTGIGNGGIYTYTYGTPFSTDTTFKVDVYDGKNTTTKTIKVEFVNPFYCGLASGTLQEIVQKKGAYTYNNITCNNDSIVFKYPKSYGTLTSILDSNNFENISAFSRNEEVINSVDYYVYTSAVTTVSNFKFIFKF